MEGIALIFFVFAYLIEVKGKMHLIAGYNKKTAALVTDKKGLARLVARLCIDAPRHLLFRAVPLRPASYHRTLRWLHHWNNTIRNTPEQGIYNQKITVLLYKLNHQRRQNEGAEHP